MRSQIEVAVARSLKRFPSIEPAEYPLILTEVVEEVMLAIPNDTRQVSEMQAELELKEQELIELSSKLDEMYEEKEALAHEVELLREGEPEPGSHLRIVE